jgi:hypothetical protein
MKVEFRNAFNTIDREVFLSDVKEHFPQIYNWVSYCYRQPAALIFGGEEIRSESGVQQGDPLGPFLISLALHRLVKKIDAAVPGLDLHLWYLDDGTIIADEEKVAAVFEVISLHAPDIGLQLNAAKTELWWPSGERNAPDFPSSDVKWIHDDGIELLGSPIGSDPFIHSFLCRKLSQLRDLHCKLLALNDSQVQLCIYRCCLGFGKLNHLLRTSPPAAIASVVPFIDELLRSTLCQIMGSDDIENRSWEQATLPIRLGGLGILSASDLSEPAHIASVTETLSLVSCLVHLPDAVLLAEQRALRQLTELNSRTRSDFSIKDLRSGRQGQRLLSSAVWSTRSQALLESGDLRSKARLLGTRMPHAADFLKAAPIPGYEQRVSSSAVFQMMIKRFLGVPLIAEPLSACRACEQNVMDRFGDHAMVCRRGNDKIVRHNKLTQVLGNAARDAGLQPVLERLHLLPDSNQRPGDLAFETGRTNPHTIAYDVTVTDTLQKNYLIHAAAVPGHALSKAYENKMAKSSESCADAGVSFIPLVWESLGGSSESVHKVVIEWSSAAAKRRGSTTADGLARARFGLFCRLSMTLQRFQAEMVLRRLTVPSLLSSPPLPSSWSDPPHSLSTASAASSPYVLYVPDDNGVVRV